MENLSKPYGMKYWFRGKIGVVRRFTTRKERDSFEKELSKRKNFVGTFQGITKWVDRRHFTR
jgi:hypothetical protein